MTLPDHDANRDDRLRELLAEAVDDIEPADRLAAITARTTPRAAPKGNPMNAKILAVGGAVIGTAAVITGVAWAGGAFDSSPDEPAPVATSSASPSPDTDASPSPSTEPTTEPSASPDAEPTTSASTAPTETFTSALYFVGETPQGLRLYREFQQVEGQGKLLAALQAVTADSAQDPDYSSPASGLTVEGAFRGGQAIEVQLAEAPERPQGLTDEQARLAVQQVVWTAQAVTQRPLPITFTLDGKDLEQVYGVPTGKRVGKGEPLQTLALVSLTEPGEGTVVTDGTLAVEGRASSFEANVPWRILRDGTAVKEGFFTAKGWMGKLYPFGGTIDVSGLAPGTYVLEAATADPSGGEGGGPHVDTRTFVVE